MKNRVFSAVVVLPYSPMALRYHFARHGIADLQINRRIVGVAHAFGSLVRSRRKAMRMRQDQLALATGVGRRVCDRPRGRQTFLPARTQPIGG